MPIKTLATLCCFLSAAFSAASPLFPEDASLKVSGWYFSSENRHYKDLKIWSELKRISHTHHFKLRNIGPSYQWSQDALLFDEKAALLVTAPYFESEFLEGISLGISRSWEEEAQLGPFRITPEFPYRFPSYKQLNSTFVEGGNLVSGRLQNGEPYVLLEQRAVIRAQKYLSKTLGKNISFDEAKHAVAHDLAVSPEHLYLLRSSKHLDLLLMPLPGGIILLDDPRKAPGVLEAIAAPGDTSIRPNTSNPLYSLDLETLDAIENILKEDFKVVRVAGAFENLHVNFFNGFQGRDANGNYWQVTNGARGLKRLETYWEDILQKNLPHEKVFVYFPGIYSYGAGIDCSGAVSP